MKVPAEQPRLAISLVHQPAADEAGGGAAGGGGALAAKAALFGGGKAKAPGAAGGDELGSLVPLVDERLSARALASLPQGLLWRTSWSAVMLPGEEAAMLLLQLVHPESSAKGGERQIGWVALSANATGAHHLQLHAPPLPKSASEAKSSQSELLDAWIHCELSVGVTGSIARYQALQQSRANAFSVGAASRAKRGLHRKASVLFDPLNRPMAPQGTDEYIAPDGILSAISSASTVVGTVAVTAVTAGVSAVASAVGAIGRAATFVAPAAAPPAAAAPAPGGGGGEGDGLTSDQRALLSALAPPKVRGKLPPRKCGELRSACRSASTATKQSSRFHSMRSNWRSTCACGGRWKQRCRTATQMTV